MVDSDKPVKKDASHLKPHQWKPGQSGNPLGRNVSPEKVIIQEIRRTMPEGIKKAQEKLIALIDDPDKAIALAAAKAVWAKAPDIPWEEDKGLPSASKTLPIIAALMQIQMAYVAAGKSFSLDSLMDAVKVQLGGPETIEIESVKNSCKTP